MTSSISLDAHIIIPTSETTLDALINKTASATLLLDAMLSGPAYVMFDAILIGKGTLQNSTHVKKRQARFRGAIFSHDGDSGFLAGLTKTMSLDAIIGEGGLEIIEDDGGLSIIEDDGGLEWRA